MKYNTRIAPSPTGDMHIGTARTAYFNWLAARASGGKFILRIDDTDQSRNQPEYVQVIIDTMKWLGLDYDELLFQSSRFSFYNTEADILKRRNLAQEKDGAVVLDLSKAKDLPDHWIDEISGKINITPDDLSHADGMVLIKSDGSPSYNFCSIVDDIDMDINLIIRGVDHTTNTAKQVILRSLLRSEDYPAIKTDSIKFVHVGLICQNKKPLSKRDGASSMLHYMKAGYDPDAILNFMARLGWSPTKDDKTTATLPRDKMLSMFLTEGKMKNNAANFDLNKLESFDRKYKAQKGIWRNADKLL